MEEDADRNTEYVTYIQRRLAYADAATDLRLAGSTVCREDNLYVRWLVSFASTILRRELGHNHRVRLAGAAGWSYSTLIL